MFVPLDEAFDYVRGLSGIDIHGNQTLKEMVNIPRDCVFIPILGLNMFVP